MKERPILMAGAMAKAAHDGTKTQTRRPLKVQPPQCVSEFYDLGESWKPVWCLPEFTGDIGSEGHLAALAELERQEDGNNEVIRCPFGRVGDRLWVRENFWTYPGPVTRSLLRDGADTWPMVNDVPCAYDTDGNQDVWRALGWVRKPSIHMPRALCRTVLVNTDVRVERIQETSHEDAIAEAILCTKWATKGLKLREQRLALSQLAFSHLWDELYGKGAWDRNGWTWAITFEKLAPAAQEGKG